jgi:hypothetical protein
VPAASPSSSFFASFLGSSVQYPDEAQRTQSLYLSQPESLEHFGPCLSGSHWSGVGPGLGDGCGLGDGPGLGDGLHVSIVKSAREKQRLHELPLAGAPASTSSSLTRSLSHSLL